VEGSEAGSAAAGWEAAAKEEEDSVVEGSEAAWEEAGVATVPPLSRRKRRSQRLPTPFAPNERHPVANSQTYRGQL
jgi:hypothetical protein